MHMYIFADCNTLFVCSILLNKNFKQMATLFTKKSAKRHKIIKNMKLKPNKEMFIFFKS